MTSSRDVTASPLLADFGCFVCLLRSTTARCARIDFHASLTLQGLMMTSVTKFHLLNGLLRPKIYFRKTSQNILTKEVNFFLGEELRHEYLVSCLVEGDLA
jgi:hypothetical protein